MSNSLQDMAQRQAERYEDLKETLNSAGYSHRELAPIVNIDNLDPRSQSMFARLKDCLSSIAEPKNKTKEPSRHHEAHFGLG